MIGNAPVSIQTGVPGWHTNQEAEFLMQMAGDLPDGAVIVCVGVEYGRCVSEIAFATRHLTSVDLNAVDLFPDTHPCGPLLEIFRGNLKEAGFEGKVRIWRGDSAEVGQNWSESLITMLMLDADHTYEGVKRDIQAWVPHVKEGGLIIFHDYAKHADSHPLHFEVKRAVDEFFPDLLDGPDTIVYVYKGMEVISTDDLTLLDGVGAKTAEKLNGLEIYTFKELNEADAAEIATALKTSVEVVEDWQNQALDYL